jgi:glycosyltransferase involved in cell wall biosynthesis
MVNDDRLMVNDDRLMVNGDRLMVNGKRLKIKERILLPGRSEKVIEEMNKSEIFVFSSDYEGMSNAVVEAFCVGLPIITTKVSGTEDFIKDGENGFLLDIGDTDGMEKAMRMLMSNEVLRRKMGEKNRMEAEQFKIEHIFQQWEDVVNKVANH